MAAGLRLAAAAAAAAAAVMSSAVPAAAHEMRLDVDGSTVNSDPAWVAQFAAPTGPTEQYAINYGPTPDSMVVRWATADPTASSLIQWGTSSGVYTHSVTANTSHYTYGIYTSPTFHIGTLTGLPLNTTIYYRLGAGAAQSAEMSFMSNDAAAPGGSTAGLFPTTVAFVADVGESAAANATISRVALAAPEIDSVIISGDIAYANGCEAKGCVTWDAWCRMVSPVASVKPWGMSLGNHEENDLANGVLFISAAYRFAGQPTGGRKDGLQYFSWNQGPVHVISFYSFYLGGFGADSALTRWVTADLAAVDHSATPWIIVTQHAPAYNSNKDHQGDGEFWRLGLEQLFIKSGVSAVFNGHVHAYERSFPVNNNVVVPAGPGGMTHLNIGDGGAGLYTSWLDPQPAWSAFRNATWGHGRWTVVNLTHSVWRWYDNADAPDQVGDEAWILNSNAQAWADAAAEAASA